MSANDIFVLAMIALDTQDEVLLHREANSV